MEIRQRLDEAKDESYAAFQRRLIPDVDPDTIIGVRTPQLRAMAKAMYGTDEAKAFLLALPHETFEENQIHAFLIEREKDFDRCLEQVNSFLPFIDNWATCDQLSPKALRKEYKQLLICIRQWLASDRTYVIRFGVNCLMRWYLDDAFDPVYPEWVSAIRSREYYVNMGIAWYFATALARQWDAVIVLIEQKKLDSWIHNKTIQKAVESYRITDTQKAYLKKLRMK